MNINPSAVPLEKGMGGEIIYYKSSFDFSLVKGLGRVGAAISPSNSEETFFGPPGLELPEDLETRKREANKYPSQKLTLATAFNIFNNKKKGIKRLEVNLGVMGKYNQKSSGTTGGGGLSGVAGPFTFGYSVYSDQTVIDYARYGLDRKETTQYLVETYSAGVFLSMLVLDYSVLRIVTTEIATVSMATASLLTRLGIFTGSLRTEDSVRPVYNYETQTLESQRVKKDIFFGAQFNITKSIMLGGFYNYYLLREISLGTTIFF